MATETKRPSLWRRLFRWDDAVATERAAWFESGEWQHHDLLSSQPAPPELRRLYRTNADLTACYGAVYAAIRKRVRAVAKPRFGLMRQSGKDVIEVLDHPALVALDRMDGQL